jgi:serine protease
MNKNASLWFLVAGGTALGAALFGCAPGGEVESVARDAAPLARRTPFAKSKAPKRPPFKHRLVVKFADELRIRALGNGSVRSDSRSPAALSNASAVSQIAQRFGMKFSPLIKLPEERIATLQTRATLKSKRVQPDLAGILVAEVPESRLQAAADALHASPLTEFVYFEQLMTPPPQTCSDIAPATPNYTPQQSYRGPNPGLNMTAAWSLGPTRGAGVKIADCEYGYTLAHEDLCGVIMEAGQTIHPTVISNGWDEHGTAVLGELVGRDNTYGCTGLAPDAQAYFFPEWSVEEGGRRVTAIANAIATVDEGDVVLLEMQSGPENAYVPAEYEQAVWMVVKAGTDAGVVVVAAAGNGNQNLDDPMHADYMARGDSGAIIVGAGSANTSHDRLGFSTYGSRVDVQGWGESVVSTGYGYLAEHGGDKNQRYTNIFGGTSSASPFIAAAAASLQGFAESFLGHRLTPLELRELLIETGIPQGAGGHIGPFPDMVAAVNQIMSGEPIECGDGTCNGSETCTTCPSDCGTCPSCVPAGCESATPVSIPYSLNGPMNTCAFFTGTPSHINSWNMSLVELNGVNVSNLWVPPSSYPATCNGGYYLRSVGSFPWSHVEAM